MSNRTLAQALISRAAYKLLRPLRIGVVNEKRPFMHACARESMAVDHRKCPLPGIAVETMHFLVTTLKLDVQLVQLDVPPGNYGRPGLNGTWLGYLSAVQDNTVDTIIADFTPTTERIMAFRFT